MSDNVLAQIKLIPVVRALALISQGKTKKRACELVGISTDTFDLKVQENPTLASDFLTEERGKILAQYQELMGARATMLKDFIDAAKNPDTSIKTKLAIDERLRIMQESMELELGLISTDQPQLPAGGGSTATDAETFIATRLTGPALRRGTGKATVRETTIEFSLEGTSHAPEEPVEEGEVLDSKPE